MNIKPLALSSCLLIFMTRWPLKPHKIFQPASQYDYKDTYIDLSEQEKTCIFFLTG